jgi:hypothetical protein
MGAIVGALTGTLMGALMGALIVIVFTVSIMTATAAQILLSMTMEMIAGINKMKHNNLKTLNTQNPALLNILCYLLFSAIVQPL